MNLELTMTLLTTSSFALIWYVQLISYPLFLYVGENNWLKYHNEHVRRITWIMAPLMLAQLSVSLLLAFQSQFFELVGVILVFLITFLWAVPLHNQLTEKYEISLVQKLIRSNFYRSIIWTILWAYCLVKVL